MKNVKETDDRHNMNVPANERVVTKHRFAFVTH
jgi:hypothetical protein